jgi:hypothetical protein
MHALVLAAALSSIAIPDTGSVQISTFVKAQYNAFDKVTISSVTLPPIPIDEAHHVLIAAGFTSKGRGIALPTSVSFLVTSTQLLGLCYCAMDELEFVTAKGVEGYRITHDTRRIGVYEARAFVKEYLRVARTATRGRIGHTQFAVSDSARAALGELADLLEQLQAEKSARRR